MAPPGPVACCSARWSTWTSRARETKKPVTLSSRKTTTASTLFDRLLRRQGFRLVDGSFGEMVRSSARRGGHLLCQSPRRRRQQKRYLSRRSYGARRRPSPPRAASRKGTATAPSSRRRCPSEVIAGRYFSTAATARRAAPRVARAAGDGAGVDVSKPWRRTNTATGRLPGGPLRRKCGKILPRARRRGRGRPRRARGGNAITTTVRGRAPRRSARRRARRRASERRRAAARRASRDRARRNVQIARPRA